MPVNQLSECLDYYGLARVPSSTLRAIGRALGQRLEPALDRFYRTITQRPDPASHLSSAQQMSRAKGLQAEHWQSVFRDGVDDRFHKRALRIGEVHARIGLEPRWYVGAYGMVLEELITAIVARGWLGWLPWRRARARELAKGRAA